MALEYIPYVSLDTLMAHEAELRTDADYMRVIGEAKEHLRGNSGLLYLVEMGAGQSQNPDILRSTVYAILNALNSQLKAEALKKQMEK